MAIEENRSFLDSSSYRSEDKTEFLISGADSNLRINSKNEYENVKIVDDLSSYRNEEAKASNLNSANDY